MQMMGTSWEKQQNGNTEGEGTNIQEKPRKNWRCWQVWIAQSLKRVVLQYTHSFRREKNPGEQLQKA